MDCYLSIEDYFNSQINIKTKLKELKQECPELVLKYLLKTESKNRINLLLECKYTDKLDKKLYQDYLKMDTCKNFKKIFN